MTANNVIMPLFGKKLDFRKCLFCVIFAFFFFHAWFRSFKEGASEATPRSQEAKTTPV